MLDAFRCALPFQRLLGRAGLRFRRGRAGGRVPDRLRDLLAGETSALRFPNVVLRAMGQAQSSVRAAHEQAGQRLIWAPPCSARPRAAAPAEEAAQETGAASDPSQR